MTELENVIHEAQSKLNELFLKVEASGGLTEDQYARFLTMQFHLTKGVQRHFFAIASQSEVGRKSGLRKWLLGFGAEEEFHYRIAQADLKSMNREPGDCPLDVQLWWLYFDSVIPQRPFLRLGATSILENIADGATETINRVLAKASFLDQKNTRFLTIHRHGPNLDHGEQILQALKAADLGEGEVKDLVAGAKTATTFYLRFMSWVIGH